MTEADEIR